MRADKQTAVDFIEYTLNKRLIHLSNEKIHIKHFVRTAKCAEVRKILEIINQAKKMEREALIEFYEDGLYAANYPHSLTGEAYFQKEYGNKD
jgi:hypothetical protein